VVAVVLYIDGDPSTLAKTPHQIGDRDLGCATTQVELGVGAKDPTDPHTEGPSDEFVAIPDLDAVRMPRLVQPAQAAEQLIGQPSGFTAEAAVVDHALETRVERGGPVDLAQLLSQAPLDTGTANGDDRSWIGRPPGHAVRVSGVAQHLYPPARYRGFEADFVEQASFVGLGGEGI
jgi:hypothetical protein